MRLYYTDGAYSSRSKLAGWACVVIADSKVFAIKNGYEPYSTNNRGELIAFLYALEQIDRRDDAMTVINDIFSILLQVENYLDEKYRFLGKENIARDYTLHIIEQLAEVCD